MQENDRYQVLNTKVSPDAWLHMNALAQRLGTTVYDLVQVVCDVFLRYKDDRHNLSPEMERVMMAFDHLKAWSKTFNLADATVQKEVGEAIYFLQEPHGKKQGVRAVHVTKPYFGERTQTVNVQEIFDRVIRLMFPDRYDRLHKMRVEMDCNSLLDMLDQLLEEHQREQDSEELRKMFEDCDRHEWGRKIAYGKRTKRVKHHSVDEMHGLFDHEQYEGGTEDDLECLYPGNENGNGNGNEN
jgi:hypothetical protein